MGTLAKIRRLYFREKLAIREISRQTGMSRNTVRNWLRELGMIEPKYPARVVVTKLDAYADTLRQWCPRRLNIDHQCRLKFDICNVRIKYPVDWVEDSVSTNPDTRNSNNLKPTVEILQVFSWLDLDIW